MMYMISYHSISTMQDKSSKIHDLQGLPNACNKTHSKYLVYTENRKVWTQKLFLSQKESVETQQ